MDEWDGGKEESWMNGLVGRDSFWTGVMNCCEPIAAKDHGPAVDSPVGKNIHFADKTKKSQEIRSWAQKNGVAGVGINFREKPGGSRGLEVMSTAPGGPAHTSGQIELGDELTMIDDIQVGSMDHRQLAPYILGGEGTIVTLTFFTKGTGATKKVRLVRSTIDSQRVGSDRRGLAARRGAGAGGGRGMAGGGVTQAGVGIYFEQETSGGDTRCTVASLAEGGSAAASKRVFKGDILLKIDDHEVLGADGESLGQFLLGPEGSKVRITFQVDGRHKVVELIRGSTFVSSDESFGQIR
ncbi:hypothetical protein T484DRAFT_3369062 [Baffinella frigidus]|nr:hypothetical protein T484DRAFT_3369062 [Cryptophyta sp. CCMP2293]